MKVLIAFDESPVSARAAREAARLFDAAATEFLVINVARIPTPWAYDSGYGMVSTLNMDPRWFEAYEEAETGLLARAKAAGVSDPETVTAAGDPVRLICEAAEEHDVDVIVVGSHDRTALRRLLDPSVSAGVVRATYRPVLVVSGTPPLADSEDRERTGEPTGG